MIGPPMAPPNWFCLKGGFGCPARLEKKLLASKRVVAQELVGGAVERRCRPDLVTTLTCPPGLRPCSAEKRLVWTLNSWIASTLGRMTMTRVSRVLLSIPS